MASKHLLRRSCAFCRARKIKCSNETICEACRRQGADCIYDFELPRPKAGTISADSSQPGSALRDDRFSSRQGSCTNGALPYSGPFRTISEELREDVDNVAEVLEQKFYETFSKDNGPGFNPWQGNITDYHHSAQNSVRERLEAKAAKFDPKNVKYTGILNLITLDLVGLVTDQFGCLGCHHLEDNGARFLFSGLIGDKTQTMFDKAPLSGNPLAEYGQRQQTQLIDVWFSVHPLSFLVSKTLLLKELRDGTYDEILLATMLADANFSIGDEVAMATGYVLLQWATAQLQTRRLRSNQFSPDGGAQYRRISTGVFSGISTGQALMLLAWNALCSFQIRRAICYISVAGTIAIEIKEQISSTSAPMSSSRINGIDIFDVQKELMAYLYWTTYSLNFWTFIQMGNGDFSGLLPTSLTSTLLPVTEASSVIIQLDMVSGNFNTLQKQKSAIREMWPLAHIASVVAYIFALNPHDVNTHESPQTKFWQGGPILALQCIQQGQPSQDVGSVCRQISKVLMESTHILNKQVNEVSSRSLVLLVYHTMAIHFLFPMVPQGKPEQGVPAEVVDRFCTCSEEILQVFILISEQPQDLFSITTSTRSSFHDLFCLALDTCARALNLIHTKKKIGAFLMDLPMMHAYHARLQMLAEKLYTTSQNDFLNQVRSLKMVRKHLKACIRAFSKSGSRSASSGVPSPDDNSESGSPMAQFPMGSGSGRMSTTATTTTAAVIGPIISFVSPMDITMLPQSIHSSLPCSDSERGSVPYTPVDDLHNPYWTAGDELFHNLVDPDALGAPAGGHLTVSDLVDQQNDRYLQMPWAMDFCISGPMTGEQRE